MTAAALPSLPASKPLLTALATGPRTALVATVAELTAIYQEDVNLVVLPRLLGADVQGAVQALAAGPEFKATVQVGAAQPDLCALPFFKQAEAAPLLADLTYWIQAFAALFDGEQIGLRICHSRSVLCPRFHIDRVPVRLVCAYAGRSLQWLAEPDVDRGFLGHQAGGRSDEESGLLRRQDAIQSVPPQAIVLCRGEAWPGQAGRASVHRSPPALAQGQGRLVLTLDLL